MSRRNLDIVDQAFEAYFEGDLERVGDLTDPSLVITQFEELPDPETYRGRSGFFEAIAAWAAEWDDMHVERLRSVEAGDHVVTTMRQTGRGRVSGVEVTGEYSFVFTFRHGKLVRWQMFTDEAEALEVAGATVYG